MPTEAQKLAAAYGPQPMVSAASMRAPMRGEILVLAILGTNKTFTVPDLWKGCIVNFFADGGDVYLQFSTAAGAVADKSAVSTESGVGPYTVASSGNEAWKIPNGQWLPVPVPANAASMGTQGSTACQLRTHVAET